MKLIYTALCLFIAFTIANAQDVTDNLKNAEKLYQQQKYAEFVNQLETTIEIVQKEQLTKLKQALLPGQIGKYTLQENEAQDESFINGDEVQLTALYVKTEVVSGPEKDSLGNIIPEKTKQLQMNITISNSPDKVYKVAKQYAGNNSGSTEQATNNIDYRGYRAILELNQQRGKNSFTVIAGASVLKITSKDINTKDDFLQVANELSLENIINQLGK